MPLSASRTKDYFRVLEHWILEFLTARRERYLTQRSCATTWRRPTDWQLLVGSVRSRRGHPWMYTTKTGVGKSLFVGAKPINVSTHRPGGDRHEFVTRTAMASAAAMGKTGIVGRHACSPLRRVDICAGRVGSIREKQTAHEALNRRRDAPGEVHATPGDTVHSIGNVGGLGAGGARERQ